MKKWDTMVLAGAVMLMAGLGVWSWIGIIRGEIVIEHGIGLYRVVRTALVILAVSGTVLALSGIYFGGKQEKAEEAARIRRGMRPETSPALIRKGLAKAQSENPSFPFDRCARQLDLMDEYKSHLRRILRGNEFTPFRSTEDILREAESEMCGDIREFMNEYLAMEDKNRAMKSYESLLRQNEKRFESIRELLAALNEFGSGKISQERTEEKVRLCSEAIKGVFFPDMS